MSVRYTGEALAMSPVVDDTSLRDVDQWKDRLEVRLDNRQVFFLFFGSAMVACLLFVLGVIVGKKLETRGHAETPAIDDPLAILDRLGSQGPMPVEQAVTFPKALTAPTSSVGRKAASAARAEVTHAEAPRPEPRPSDVAPAVVRSKPAPSLPATQPPALAAKPVTAAPVVAKPATAPAIAPPAATSGKGRFTLQLSAFQDKAEAEAMAHRLGSAHVTVVATDIPGKGTWYRVRAGSFSSFQEASTAKSTFEREHNIIAYVAATTPPGVSTAAGSTTATVPAATTKP